MLTDPGCFGVGMDGNHKEEPDALCVTVPV
jgi:hypothetical protein